MSTSRVLVTLAYFVQVIGKAALGLATLKTVVVFSFAQPSISAGPEVFVKIPHVYISSDLLIDQA